MNCISCPAALRIVFLLMLLSLRTSPAMADGGICQMTGLGTEPSCPSPAILRGNAPPFNGNSDYFVAQSVPGVSLYPIHAFGQCRYVDNISSGKVAFVSFKTRQKWQAFISRFTPSNASFRLTTCALPTIDTIYPNSVCKKPLPAVQKISLGYERTGKQIEKKVSFICTISGECNYSGCGADQTWTQTVTSAYMAVNSDKSNRNWMLIKTVHSGEPPARLMPPDFVPDCTPLSERRQQDCPQKDEKDEKRKMIEERKYTCPEGAWGEWIMISDNCHWKEE